ncbi:MAG: HEAT repeat domain-containing protein, partial [Pirellulaceae bacterium]|nr:HEAT repeat domain-containing protein [Pirellulaceae bacterium]
MRAPLSTLPLGLLFWACLLTPLVAQEVETPKPPLTGPETEKRFPPLKVPPGFRATLFACDPLIEYPSVMSAGPRPGAVFVAVDYMTGLGTEITRRSEVRLVEDTNGDGYADKATLYAGGFNSIMGLTYHDGAVFVMHAPFLTALRDTKGTGVADERKDIVAGLGLTPEENPVRLHCANGVTAGHDGWLYLALGDHGCSVNRPEGDKLVLEGGGILRCRPDGRDLHIFSTGLRNIYDVALDAELNVFTRDNENDGGDYKIRVCHSFFGADHGYPYDYYERARKALAPIADLGLGSSAGGICYLETQLPAQFRGNLIFCEWGKSLVRYELARSGSGFVPSQEFELATSAENDLYGFKPTDVVVQRDGTLMVSDYADGQRPKRGRGRIYQLEWDVDIKPPKTIAADAAIDELIVALDSPSYQQRCEAQLALERRGDAGATAVADVLMAKKLSLRGSLHAVWILASVQKARAIEPLLQLAEAGTFDERLRAQAVRAIADLADPVLVNHRLDASPGDAALAARLAKIRGKESLQLEVLVALGRLKWEGLANHLAAFENGERPLRHAAAKALRRAGNWPATLRLLDGKNNSAVEIALFALADVHEPVISEGLIERMSKAEQSLFRDLYADLLARAYKKPAPWVYWDYRPKPRPANTVAWERTEAIGAALNRVLLDSESSVRVQVLQRMQREKIPAELHVLGKWLEEEQEGGNVALLLAALQEHSPGDRRPHLAVVILAPKQSETNRLLALSLFTEGLDATSAEELLRLASRIADGPVLAALLRQCSKIAKEMAVPLLQAKLASEQPDVRAAAIQGLGELRATEGREAVLTLLADKNPLVRRAAATAAGRLEVTQATEPLLKLGTDGDLLVRAASLDSLRMLKEPRVLPLAVAALSERKTEQVALLCLRELGGPEHAPAVVEFAQRNPSATVLTGATAAITAWRDRPGTSPAQQEELDKAVAKIHGASGSVIRWKSNSRYLYSSGTEGRVTLETKAT